MFVNDILNSTIVVSQVKYKLEQWVTLQSDSDYQKQFNKELNLQLYRVKHALPK